jgi:SAM-dependent methyltransferase
MKRTLGACIIKYSKDYHDYVFRDGKLVADFEAMYLHSENVPWHQDEQGDWVDVRLTGNLLMDIGPFDEIHDLGCGLGHHLALMCRDFGAKGCRGFGYDISETACAKARNLFPELTFHLLDLMTIPENPIVLRTPYSVPRRLFILRGVLWYVFPKIANVIIMIRSLMLPEDKLLVVQNFPWLDDPFIGKDVIPNYLALIRHFSCCLLPDRHLWYETSLKAPNDNWFIGIFSPKDTE